MNKSADERQTAREGCLRTRDANLGVLGSDGKGVTPFESVQASKRIQRDHSRDFIVRVHMCAVEGAHVTSGQW